jgi:hypothetical protein
MRQAAHLPPTGAMTTMRSVARLVLILVILGALVSASAAAGGTTRDASSTSRHLCTAFGKTWASKYNAAGGPVKIVSVCCGLRSVRTHNSACELMVTVRKGPGQGTYGCGLATVAANGDVLANRPQACVRAGGVVSLPT